MRALATLVMTAAWIGIVSCAADMPVAPSPASTVEGVVLHRDGEPVARARLYFQPVDPQSEYPFSHSAETNGDGSYSLELQEGTYRVQIIPPFDSGYLYDRLDFTVREGKNRLDYQYKGTLVSGSATGPGGVPVAGFRVYVSRVGSEGFGSANATNGSYSLLLPPGEYLFQAVADAGGYDNGLPRFEFEGTIGAQDTTMNLDFSGHEIDFRVSLNGVPLPGTHIGASRTGVTASNRTDVLGEATLYLPSGGYLLSVDSNAGGMTGPESRYFDVQGPGTVLVDLTGVQWNVTVRRNADLEPVRQAQVDVRETGGGKYGYAVTDLNGQFSMIVRPDWGHEIRVRPPSTTLDYVVGGVASSADSTFDLLVDIPVP